jgi:hypothetical protein
MPKSSFVFSALALGMGLIPSCGRDPAGTTEQPEGGSLIDGHRVEGETGNNEDGGIADTSQPMPDVSTDGAVNIDVGARDDARLDLSVGTDTTSDLTSSDMSSGAEGIAPDAGCGHAGKVCCLSAEACTIGTACDANGMCVACGAQDQICCAGPTRCLDPALGCVSGTCQCGAKDQLCCGGNACKSGLECSGDGGGTTCGCGDKGHLCCQGTTCDPSLRCTGIRCTCWVGCFGDADTDTAYRVRTDGTAWINAILFRYPARPLVVVSDANGQPVPGFTKIAWSGQFGCGIKVDKTLWCWWGYGGRIAVEGGVYPDPDGGIGGANYGQLGDGTTNASGWPVQVRTADGPLTNVADVDVGADFACAVTGSHHVYCWGDNSGGQLGIGTIEVARDGAPPTTFSAYPLPVVTTMGGSTAFVGVDQIGLGRYHACVHHTDNSVWCWGANNWGNLGTGDQTSSTFPVRVTGLVQPASQVAVADAFSCARTGDEAWCWGSSTYGLGDGTRTQSDSPVRVMDAGGTAFNGISDLRVSNTGGCGLKSADRSLWCWGAFDGTGDGGINEPAPTPRRLSFAGVPVVDVDFWDPVRARVCFATAQGTWPGLSASACP